jgi:hypothetical protein
MFARLRLLVPPGGCAAEVLRLLEAVLGEVEDRAFQRSVIVGVVGKVLEARGGRQEKEMYV